MAVTSDVTEYGRLRRAPDERVNPITSIPFWLLHLLPLLAIFTGVPWQIWLLAVWMYWSRMFFITAGYHRYFAHKSYRMNRFWQFVFAFGGATAAQKGPLWWAAHHRDHHRYSDTDRDVHSPRKGFWWSHVGWILCDKFNATKEENIRDFTRFPELCWLNRHDWVATWTAGSFCAFVGFATGIGGGWVAVLRGGAAGLLIGFFLSTVVLWHATFTVNSLAHVWGTRRYTTTDTSRNNVVIALYTGGEGWHNNHHRYQQSVRQGFVWWQIDTTYYVLWLLSKVGVVRGLKEPRREVVFQGYMRH